MIRIPDYGVVLVEGIPGSGKSLIALRWVIDWIVLQRRPVFTNLPIRWRVMHTWLRKRWGVEVANLIHPLTEEHFRRYIARAERFKLFREQVREEEAKGSAHRFGEEVERMFCELHGPHITRGPEANWIPRTSVVVMDEVHLWFPMRSQKEEDPALLAYISMHRHVLHQIVAITQNRMQVSINLRRNAAKIWQVRDKGNDKLAWGIKFRHTGIKCIGYSCWDATTLDLPPHHELHRPIENFAWYPGLPWNQYLFRLYNSFTGASSPRVLLREMKSVRVENGLTESGATPLEVERMKWLRKRRAGRWSRRLRTVRRCVFRVLGWAAFAGMGWLVGQSTASHAQGGEELAAERSQERPKEPKSWGIVSAMTSEFVRMEGRRYAIGDRMGPGILSMVDVRRRVCWVRGDDGVWWMWQRGGEPRTVGTIDDLRSRALAGGVRADGADPGASGDPEGLAAAADGDVQR